jgi:hypothetical protein
MRHLNNPQGRCLDLDLDDVDITEFTSRRARWELVQAILEALHRCHDCREIGETVIWWDYSTKPDKQILVCPSCLTQRKKAAAMRRRLIR